MIPPQNLLRHLQVRGPLSPQKLRELLQVSPSTITRLAKQLPGEVIPLGKTRRTSYAALRSVDGLGTSVPVLQIDEAGTPHPWGRIHFLFGEGTAFERASSEVSFHGAIPWFLEDARPQGFLGRAFVIAHPELNLPPIQRWLSAHILQAVALRGEDLAGNLVIGEMSTERFFRRFSEAELLAQAVPLDERTRRYPELARAALAGNDPGSSAGGEQPKFSALRLGPEGERQWVLVKFSPRTDSEEGRRWADLLLCEHHALQILREHGLPAAESQCLESENQVFLEVARFDRVGARGRRPVVSLFAIDAELIGGTRRWSHGAERLRDARLLSSAGFEQVLRLEAFGRMIANNDQHLGNISFFWKDGDRFELAPIYDMVPMAFRPESGHVVDRPLAPVHPDVQLLGVWAEMRDLAMAFWSRVQRDDRISARFRDGPARAAVALLS